MQLGMLKARLRIRILRNLFTDDVDIKFIRPSTFHNTVFSLQKKPLKPRSSVHSRRWKSTRTIISPLLTVKV
jgi:hypothetical protein